MISRSKCVAAGGCDHGMGDDDKSVVFTHVYTYLHLNIHDSVWITATTSHRCGPPIQGSDTPWHTPLYPLVFHCREATFDPEIWAMLADHCSAFIPTGGTDCLTGWWGCRPSWLPSCHECGYTKSWDFGVDFSGVSSHLGCRVIVRGCRSWSFSSKHFRLNIFNRRFSPHLSECSEQFYSMYFLKWGLSQLFSIMAFSQTSLTWSSGAQTEILEHSHLGVDVIKRPRKTRTRHHPTIQFFNCRVGLGGEFSWPFRADIEAQGWMRFEGEGSLKF